MTVYVYKYGGQGPKPFSHAWPPPWFGMTADTEEELHPFAEEIGLYRHFYRALKDGNRVLPLVGHYDLDEGERDRAVAKGAQSVTRRQHEQMLRRLAGERGIKLPRRLVI